MMGYGYGYGSGMGAGGWIAMTIFWVALITLVVWGVSRAFGSTGGGTGGSAGERSPRPSGHESAEDIVDRRFAAGEIDEDTHRSMRAALRSSRAAGREPR